MADLELDRAIATAVFQYRGETIALCEAARLAIECGETAVKLFLAEAMEGHAIRAAGWERRLHELGAPLTPEERQLPPLAPGATGQTGDALAAYGQLAVDRLLDGLAVAAGTTDPVSDAPGHRLAEASADALRRLGATLDGLRASVGTGQRLSTGSVTGNGTYQPPSRPARDPVFLTGRVSATVAAEDIPSVARQILHANLTDLELATIKVCSLFILCNPDMPGTFRSDMARQAWDEARHARAFLDRFLALGGRLGERPTSFANWDIVRGQRLALGLTCHQLIGEWIGVDGALWLGEFFRRAGDRETGRIFDFVARDECTHVGFGTRWIAFLEPQPEARSRLHEEASSLRGQHGKRQVGPLAFPLQRWACELAGMDEATIAGLVRRYELSGSLRPSHDP